MSRKIVALTLLAVTAFVAIVGGLMMTARAADTNPTGTDACAAIASSDSISNKAPFWGMGELMTNDQCFGGGPRGHGGHRLGGMGNIEVSSEYAATVNAILDNDTDVQHLISEGYNVTSIRPIVKSVIEADGTLTTKATTATALLTNGASGYATVSVDVANAKVTQIIIVSRTVIDKTSS